jgi:signal transduction histidine kinase
MLRKEWETLRLRAGPGPGEPCDEGQALIEESLEGVERVAGIVRDMRDFSRGADGERGPCDLNAVVEGSVRMASTSRHGGTRVEERYGEIPPVPGAEGQLRQVALNLIVNALQAVEPGGRVVVTTFAEHAHVVLRVEDDGCGIREEHLERLFDPFFTTKPAGEGTGLGLYVSYEIVRSHGGEIRVHAEPGRGASFEVRLPLRGAAAGG